MTNFSMEGQEQQQQIAVSVPLFLRKLWKMVNDEEAGHIIGWNSTGDGFVIFDQLQFVTKLLSKYFKHSNMSSFVRQLNFYDFHKVSGLDKDQIEFVHSCFLKDLPETLIFIRRKCTSLQSKLTNHIKEEELSEMLSGVKELKTKHSLVDNELKLLKQENAALWNEVNNLRLKHAKQTKIINKIIHFLISYMHQNSLSKGKVSVSRRNTQNIEPGPSILEIDYPSTSHSAQKNVKGNSYTVSEPGYSGAITYPPTKLETLSNIQPAEHTLDEILSKVDAATNKRREQTDKLVMINAVENSAVNTLENSEDNATINIKAKIPNETNSGPDSVQEITATASKSDDEATLGLFNTIFKKRQGPGQNPVKYSILENPKQNLGMYIDTTQVELNSLQDILNNLSSTELTNFYNLIDESQMDSSEEYNENVGETSIDQEIYQEPIVTSEDNSEYLKDSLVEELATLPIEPNTTTDTLTQSNVGSGEYNADNLQDIEPDILVDQYFAI